MREIRGSFNLFGLECVLFVFLSSSIMFFLPHFLCMLSFE